ncbi:hypothetical protein [Erythrobacter sp.]|uniref:hypothetical protein n=1 Tax=Erythrobacter sp. TaxID=1042 RepID=UPI002EB1EFF1|nr:hypothetical protein [Erythrobacter sp.]
MTLAPSTPATPQSPIGEARIDARPTPQVEAQIERAAGWREANTSQQPRVTVQHSDFGSVSVRLDANGGDWRATLAARDPAFVPAVQAALAERAVAAASEASAGQGHSQGQRGSDQNASSQSGAQSGSPQHGAGQSGSSEPRYGSSPGSEQGAHQPYPGQNASDDEAARRVDGAARTDRAGTARGGDLFA